MTPVPRSSHIPKLSNAIFGALLCAVTATGCLSEPAPFEELEEDFPNEGSFAPTDHWVKILSETRYEGTSPSRTEHWQFNAENQLIRSEEWLWCRC